MIVPCILYSDVRRPTFK